MITHTKERTMLGVTQCFYIMKTKCILCNRFSPLKQLYLSIENFIVALYLAHFFLDGRDLLDLLLTQVNLRFHRNIIKSLFKLTLSCDWAYILKWCLQFDQKRWTLYEYFILKIWFYNWLERNTIYQHMHCVLMNQI